MINDDDELIQVVQDVSSGLQEIQDYVGTRPEAMAKVRFPRGYIRTARHHRIDLWFLDEADRRNISYSRQSIDILRWIANRTDLDGPAKKLLNRIAIVMQGSIAEVLALKGTAGTIGRTVKFRTRLRRMHEDFGIIDQALRRDLGWLWEQRNSIHLDRVTGPHIELFDVRDVNRANRVVRHLVDRLSGWHDEDV